MKNTFDRLSQKTCLRCWIDCTKQMKKEHCCASLKKKEMIMVSLKLSSDLSTNKENFKSSYAEFVAVQY